MNVGHEGDIHQTGFLYLHLNMIGLLLVTRQYLFVQIVFSKVHIHMLAMKMKWARNRLQVVYMTIRY